MLGDRIAIMAGGLLRCVGSSLFLKTRSGIGYTLTIVRGEPDRCQPADVLALVQRTVPDAQLLGAAGGELRLRLPLAAVSKFEQLFLSLEGEGRKDLGVGAFGMHFCLFAAQPACVIATQHLAFFSVCA